MLETLRKSKLYTNKNKPKIKQEVNITKQSLLPHLQAFKQKLLSGSGFSVYKELRRLSINR